MHATKQRLILAGLGLMLARGYNAVGVQDVLSATGVPKGSFYHHFASKEDFALHVIDGYQANVHALLHATLTNRKRAPLDRIRDFFDGVRAAYAAEGYLGCFLGALGQELSGASEVFRHKIEGCLAQISGGIGCCLDEARTTGDIAASTDTTGMADLLVNAWEGAALRSRLARNSHPFDPVLDFYFTAMTKH
ncbi:TetR family transcriptional regulator C-terminal domain-containing protein [Gemmatimonas sp.]|uniref:TetR/AcrR family transcriptional regulator n=1 Tax=Gemmatimonas sp. TaxID=1962908 RepID=UPI003983A9FE